MPGSTPPTLPRPVGDVPGRRRRPARFALAGLLVLPAFGCSRPPSDPEKTEDWKVGQCVTIDKSTDIDEADCNGPNDGEIVKVISPLDTISTCQGGSRRVREDMITGGGSVIQEVTVCLKKKEDPETPGTSGTTATSRKPSTGARLTASVTPGNVRSFDAPATQIQDAEDLTEYLLPGMSGSGADCVRDTIDVDKVLRGSPTENLTNALDTVLTCLDARSVGRLVNVYAYGMDADRGTFSKNQLCVSDAFADTDIKIQRAAVGAIFNARVDLQGPVGSPGIARDQVAKYTSCAK